MACSTVCRSISIELSCVHMICCSQLEHIVKYALKQKLLTKYLQMEGNMTFMHIICCTCICNNLKTACAILHDRHSAGCTCCRWHVYEHGRDGSQMVEMDVWRLTIGHIIFGDSTGMDDFLMGGLLARTGGWLFTNDKKAKIACFFVIWWVQNMSSI